MPPSDDRQHEALVAHGRAHRDAPEAARAVLDAEVVLERPQADGSVFGLEVTTMWEDPRERKLLRIIVEVFQRIGPGDEDWTRGLGVVEVLRAAEAVVGVRPM